MLFELQNYLKPNSIYLWVNFSILPFWLMLFFIPQLKITRILINSVIIPLILASTYCYLIYQDAFAGNISFLEIFSLYRGLDDLYAIFSNEVLLVSFWLHFIAINIFLGSWVAFDAVKYNIPKGLLLIPLLLIYISGPTGLVLYWFIRVFYAKKLNLHD